MSVYQSASLSLTLSSSHPSSLDSVSTSLPAVSPPPPSPLYTFACFPVCLSQTMSSLSVWWRITNGLHWGVNCVGVCVFCRLCTHKIPTHHFQTEHKQGLVGKEDRKGNRGKEADMCGVCDDVVHCCVSPNTTPYLHPFASPLFLHRASFLFPLTRIALCH